MPEYVATRGKVPQVADFQKARQQPALFDSSNFPLALFASPNDPKTRHTYLILMLDSPATYASRDSNLT